MGIVADRGEGATLAGKHRGIGELGPTRGQNTPAATRPQVVAVPESRSSVPPIWVLNLRRSVDRREYVTRHLSERGLSFELVESVDGRALGSEVLHSKYDAAEAKRALSRELTPSEIGCALTHLGLYQRMLDEDVPQVLILEDDVVLEPACVEMLHRLERFPEDWELILLFHNGGQASRWGRLRLDATHDVVRFASHAWGTGGYLLKQSAARKLLRIGYPVRVPSDSLTGGGIPNGIALYGVSPPVIHSLPSERAPTTMPETYVYRAAMPTPAQGWLEYAYQRARLRAFALLHTYRPLLPPVGSGYGLRDWVARKALARRGGADHG